MVACPAVCAQAARRRRLGEHRAAGGRTRCQGLGRVLAQGKGPKPARGKALHTPAVLCTRKTATPLVSSVCMVVFSRGVTTLFRVDSWQARGAWPGFGLAR